MSPSESIGSLEFDSQRQQQAIALVGRVEALENSIHSSFSADEHKQYFLTNGSRRINGQVIIDYTGTEALLVRKNNDGGDVFVVDTTNDRIGVNEIRALSASGLTLYESGGTGIFIQNSTGRVGIGTSSPTGPLHLVTNADTNMYFESTDTLGRKWFFGADNLGPFYIRDATASNAIRLAILATGNIGIGTDTPNQKLTIEGTMSIKEQAAANDDTAAYGQLWVKDTTPNQLWFTRDDGTDVQVA